MRTHRKILLTLSLVLSTTSSAITYDLKKVCQGPDQITDIQFAPNREDAFVALGKAGEIQICFLKTGLSRSIQKLEVVTYSEMGLLSIAFDPKFPQNGRYYLHLNRRKNGLLFSHVDEWKFENAKDLSKPRFVRTLFEQPQPYSNHNGGTITFSPNGTLLLGLGDGGAANDPHGNSQNPKSLLGKILEFDLSEPSPKPTIYASGLRNPWKMAWTPDAKLIVADVGQNKFEEIDFVEKGKNYGWNVKEGKHCFKPQVDCNREGLVDPIHEYGRELGQSITGGAVAEDNHSPSLKGRYVFGDFASGRIWALSLSNSNDILEIGKWSYAISTFGKTPRGEILVGDFNTGAVYMIRESK